MENPITRSATPETRTAFGPSSYQDQSDSDQNRHSSNSSKSSLTENPATSDIPGSDLKKTYHNNQ